MSAVNQFVRDMAVAVLKAYKWAISPLVPPACRYVPTCSEYAMEAIDRYGVLRGSLKALWRLLRCHPFVKGGYDPVVKVLPGPGACDTGSRQSVVPQWSLADGRRE